MNILNDLTIKHLKMNKKRTVVTIIGIMLSTFLMVGIGLLFSAGRESSIKSIIESEGEYHTVVQGIDDVQKERILNYGFVKDLKSMDFIGYAKNGYADYFLETKIIVRQANESYLSTVNLTKGHLPEEKNEIIVNANFLNNLLDDFSFSLGDTIRLEFGEEYESDRIDFDTYDEYLKATLDSFVITKTEEYKIVGVYDEDPYSNWNYFTFYTIENLENEVLSNKCFVTFDSLKKTLDYSERIKNDLKLNDDNFSPNSGLLALYGISTNDSSEDLIMLLASYLMILLAVIALGCIIVIYNSFAISVMERKKQFGLMSSIGASRKQIRKTVFFEALIVGAIGIVLGIISAFIGIYLLLLFLNTLLPKDFGSFDFAVYPLFVIIPIIFMVVVVFVSASRPSKKASKISPIEAIRLNDDIKLKRGKVKSNKLIRKIFGMEGEIAYKTMKRNKKKYRITIISLVVSIVLFIVFSSLIDYMFGDSLSYVAMTNYDFYIHIAEKDYDKTYDILDRLKATGEVEEERVSLGFGYATANSNYYKNYFTDDYKDYLNDFEKYDGRIREFHSASITILRDEDFIQYAKKSKLDTKTPILYNYFNTTVLNYDRKAIPHGGDIFKSNKFSIEYCDEGKYEDYIDYNYVIDKSTCKNYLGEFNISSENYLGSVGDMVAGYFNIFVSESMFEKMDNSKVRDIKNRVIHLRVDNHEKVEEEMIAMAKEEFVSADTYFENVKRQSEETRNMIFAIRLMVYGFIVLVTLIGVTSVFNTITTSVALRRKEFAMLRSIGLSNKGFNKMIMLESIFLGCKALFFGIIIAISINYGLFQLQSLALKEGKFFIAFTPIMISIIAVFIIVYITMRYSIKEIKKENILDVIREENI